MGLEGGVEADEGFAEGGGGLVGGGLGGGEGAGAGDGLEGGGDGFAVIGEGLVEEGEDVLVEGDVVAVALGDDVLDGIGDGVLAGADGGDVEAGVVGEFPAEEDFEEGEGFVKTLGEAGECEMGGEVGLGGGERLLIAIAGEEIAGAGEACEELALEIVVRGGGGVLIEGEALHALVLRMKAVMAGEVILRDHALDGLAEDSDVGGGPREACADAEGHVALEDSEGGEAARGPAEEAIPGPPEETGVDGVGAERRVFPLDEAIEGGAAALGEMKIDEGGRGHGSKKHGRR